MQFLDTKGEWVYDHSGSLDGTRYQAAETSLDLENFFSRPVVIANFTWSNSVTMYQTFNPWQLFCEQKRVINRLSNYRCGKFKLHVKLVINGSPFYYGRLMANYVPLYGFGDDMTTNRALVWTDNIAASQTPHVYLDPTTSTGGQIDLPFLWRNNDMDLVQAEWNVMGTMFLRSVAPLQNTTGTVDPLTITVFAWASEVSLSAPTIQNPSSIVPQSSEEPGSVSTTAASIAAMAGALSSAPVIGKYARAAEVVAGAIADRARILGFSRPTRDPGGLIVPNPFPEVANTNTSDSSIKLSLDHLQGVTVDPSVTGGPSAEDEMTLKSIATRESILCYFTWNTTSAYGAQLYQCRVTPSLFDRYANREIHMTPVCFAAVPFRCWRGSIEYRFTVISSAFHKGRLRFFYEPSKFNSSTTGQYNVNQSVILDLNESREVVIRVGWGSPHTYCQVDPPTYASTLPFSSLADPSVLTPASDFYRINGYLGVEVVTPLSNPNPSASNNVIVLVHCRAGDDIEFANPANTQGAYAYRPFPDTPASLISPTIELQSSEEVGPSQDHMEPVSAGAEEMSPAIDDSDPTNLICFGDPIVSIRQLLKRYCFQGGVSYVATYTGAPVSSCCVFILREPDFPGYRGIYTDTGNTYVTGTGADPTGYYWANNTYLNYFTPAFVCRRGGIRRTYALSSFTSSSGTALSGPSYVGQCANFQVERRPGIDLAGQALIPHVSATPIISYQQSRRQSNFCAGGAGAQLERFGVISVELPYHSPSRFVHGRTIAMFSLPEYVGGQYHNLLWNRILTNSVVPMFNAYVAAADDFSLSYFLSVPIMYFSSNTLYA